VASWLCGAGVGDDAGFLLKKNMPPNTISTEITNTEKGSISFENLLVSIGYSSVKGSYIFVNRIHGKAKLCYYKTMKDFKIFSLLKPDQKADFNSLRKKQPYLHIVDTFENQLEELFLARHPKLKMNPAEAKKQSAELLASQKKKLPEKQGSWVYFPWNSALVHILEEEDFFELRTARNKNLITQQEQTKFRVFRIGIAGLSVGNSAALALALEGFETMRLADFDELSLSNLNRIRGSITQLGLNKALITARQMYELNPYAKLELFEKGIQEKINLQKFISGPPKLNLLIDETDDVIMKIELRKIAKRFKIPVLSIADNGTNAICDVERFDLEPNRKLYHGLLGDIENQNLEGVSFPQKIKLINSMVGVDYVASRMKQSVLEVGNTLYSWPQLGGAAMLSGAAITYLAKKIAAGEKLKSGKYDVNFDRIFDTQYDSPAKKQHRAKETKSFLLRQERIFS
jgi:hypothetical protein